MSKSLLFDGLVTVVVPYTAAGTTTLTSSVLDMSGFDSVQFICVTGNSTSGNVLTLTGKMNTANSTSSPTPTAITGGTASSTDPDGTTNDNASVVLDIHKPTQRYVFCTVTRATQNVEIGCVVAIQYNSKKRPVTQPANVLASTMVVSQ